MTCRLLAQAHQNLCPGPLGPGPRPGGKATDLAEGLSAMEMRTRPCPISHTSLTGVGGQGHREGCARTTQRTVPSPRFSGSPSESGGPCRQARCRDSQAHGRVHLGEPSKEHRMRAAVGTPGHPSPQPEATRPGDPALTASVLGDEPSLASPQCSVWAAVYLVCPTQGDHVVPGGPVLLEMRLQGLHPEFWLPRQQAGPGPVLTIHQEDGPGKPWVSEALMDLGCLTRSRARGVLVQGGAVSSWKPRVPG